MTPRPTKPGKPEAPAPKAEKKPAAPAKQEAPAKKPVAVKKPVVASAAPPKKAEPVAAASAVKKPIVKQPAPAPAKKAAPVAVATEKKSPAPAGAKKAAPAAEVKKEAPKASAKKAAPVNVESDVKNKKIPPGIKTSTAATPSANQSRDVKAAPSRGKTTTALKADKGMAESEPSAGTKAGGSKSAAIAKQIAHKALKSVVGARLPQTLKNKKAEPGAKSGPPTKASQQAVLSRDEKLAKLLAMRGVKAKEQSKEAAKSARAGEKLVPTSVAKAAEFAETRKISTMLKKIEEHKAEDQTPTAAELAAKKKKRKKAPYSKYEVKELRQILESERDRLLKDMAVINDMAASSEASMSHTFSNHQADAATDSSALETMFVTRRYEEDRLRQVISALEKVDAGDFGLCDMCADEPLGLCETCPYIPIGRLRAKPFAKLCVACRQQMEKKNGKR